MKVCSFFIEDAAPRLIEVEYHSRFQIPSFQILGLPAPEIQEARERIVAAFLASDFEFPKKKIVVNLAPSSIRKSGTGHDLAIATKILEATLNLAWPEHLLAWGELSLDGSIKPVGKIAALIELLLKEDLSETRKLLLVLASADFETLKQLRCWRKENGLPELQHCKFTSLDHLKDLPKILERASKQTTVSIEDKAEAMTSEIPNASPHSDARLHSLLPLSPSLERILQIALIGRHHLLLLGPKGVGKSESIHWCKVLLPKPNSTQLWDQALSLESRGLISDFNAPIRQVHSQIRPSQLLGTISPRGYQAGELALAHGGLLIADEFMEWARDAKECLREPLQNETVTVTRVKGKVESKCELQFLATGNLCPCGGLPAQFKILEHAKKTPCHCRPHEVQSYFSRLSGPILDRIDLTALTLSKPKLGKKIDLNESKLQFLKMQSQISASRYFAIEKFNALPSKLTPNWLEGNLPDSSSIHRLLEDVSSLRARHKILRVARSIQALENSPTLKDEHVFESKNYRFMDNLWE